VTFVFSSSISGVGTFYGWIITLKSIDYEFKSVPAVPPFIRFTTYQEDLKGPFYMGFFVPVVS